MEFRKDCGRTKPYREPYLTGLQRFGATREQTLVVDDSARGQNSAVTAGVDCAVVHDDFVQAQDFAPAIHRIGRRVGGEGHRSPLDGLVVVGRCAELTPQVRLCRRGVATRAAGPERWLDAEWDLGVVDPQDRAVALELGQLSGQHDEINAS